MLLFKRLACKHLFIILFVSGALSAQIINAQNNSKDFKKTIQDISALFKKKKKDSTSTTVQSAGTQSATGVSGVKPGDLALAVKYIDADRLFSFNAGSAKIYKGTSSALIDSAGNYIVPYNTYDITEVFYPGPKENYQVYYNGLYAYNNMDHQWGGYMNSEGKIVVKKTASSALSDYSDNKKLIETHNSGTAYTYTTPGGKSYALDRRLENIIGGIGIERINDPTIGAWRYRKITGEIITGWFDEATPFSDGMAVVGKKDQFGEMKYGYINTDGKLVIPLQFSIHPNDFMCGFARVQPKDKTAFEYAFINKKGEIVFKQTSADVSKYGAFDHFTNYGLAFSARYIMDTTFNLIAKPDFFKSFGIPADSWFEEEGTYTIGETNPKLVFSTRTARSPYTQMPMYGFINLATKKVVMPVFELANINGIFFDPKSHLALAKVCLGRDKNNVPVYREGFINEDGLFVLVKGAGSQW